MPLEQSNMMLDMQNSQESQSTQFKYDQQNMMESIPEEFDEYKEEQNQQYSMMASEGKFLNIFPNHIFEVPYAFSWPQNSIKVNQTQEQC